MMNNCIEEKSSLHKSKEQSNDQGFRWLCSFRNHPPHLTLEIEAKSEYNHLHKKIKTHRLHNNNLATPSDHKWSLVPNKAPYIPMKIVYAMLFISLLQIQNYVNI